MNRKPRSFWRTTTAAVSTVLLGAVLQTATTGSTDAQPQDRGQEDGSVARVSGPAVYVLDGRVVAIRRDPGPPGAYGSHGVDYAPDMRAWVLGPQCGQ
jgi:hypothetical protein